MTQELDNSADETINDIDGIFSITGIAISGLALLFYPAEEVADASETDLGFVGGITKVISLLGLVGTFWSMGLLYEREVQVPKIVKWVLIPLLLLDVMLIALLCGMLALKTGSIGKVGEFTLKYIKPAICSLGAVGIIVAMVVKPDQFLKMSLIGKTVHYLPAALAYPPINKNPFYAIVILVRAGGLVTSLASDVIDISTDNND